MALRWLVVVMVVFCIQSIATCQTLNFAGDRAPRIQPRGPFTLNRPNMGLSHSVNNFNPQASSLVASRPAFRPAFRPVFRPAFPRDRFFSHNSFNRPSINLNVPKSIQRPNGINFGNEPQPNQVHFINEHSPNEVKINNIEDSNKPMILGTPRPEHPTTVFTAADREAPISFGIPSVEDRVNFPFQISKRPSSPHPDQPTEVVTATVHDSPVPSFSEFPTTGTMDHNFGVITDEIQPVVFFPGIADEVTLSPIEMIARNDSKNSIDYNNDCLLTTRGAIFEGNCSTLLHQGLCPDDHWLLLSEENGTAYCAERRCPWEQVYYEGDCVNPRDFDICGRGQILYVEITGYAECDCEPDYIYNHRTQECFAEHEQGFCMSSYYIERDENREVRCVPNPCGDERLVKALDGNCYFKNYVGKCPLGLVDILSDSETADCNFIVPHSIFEVPTLRTCPEGSRKDFFHKCRSVFRVPTQTSLPASRGECPDNYVRGPRGRCRKVISLFG